TIFGLGGNDWLFGGFGDDDIYGGAGSDVIWGGFATAEVTQADFDLNVAPNFTLPPTFELIEAQFPTGYAPPMITPAVLNGQNVEGRLGDGRDKLVGGDDTDFLFGGDEADELQGNAGNDYLDAGAGDDVDVHGGAGDDVVRGGSGRDSLHGDTGIDQLYGDGDDDNLFGDAGVDGPGGHSLAGQRLYGGAGRDSLFAYAPTSDTAAEKDLTGDQLFGGSGGDYLFGNLRQELLVGESGNDFIGGDLLRGPAYADNLIADIEGADDELRGGSGEDQLLGGGGNDVIWGGADTDWLEGQNGNDLLLGGGGIDIIVLDIGPLPSQTDPSIGVRPFDALGDEFYGHYGDEAEGDVADDNATDILLIEGTAGDDVIRLRESVAGEQILDTAGAPTGGVAVGGQLAVEYNDALLEAIWLDESGAPRIEQFRVSGLLGDDEISFVQGEGALDLSSLADRSRDFVGVFDGGPGDDLLIGSEARDRLDGGSGSDTLFGNAGDDRLWGDGGVGFTTDLDILYAGQGNDDLIGGQGRNELYAWSFDPYLGGEFGVFVDPISGALFGDSAGGTREREDTGLNRLLGGLNDDLLFGGTGLDFMYGNGGSDTLYRADGSLFESLDGGIAGDDWKEYARSTNKVWYVGASNADDVITVDYVTEPGLLQDHHLVTRLTNNNGSFSFDAQVRLDFAATDENGNLIWDASDLLLDLDPLRTNDLQARNEALAALQQHEEQLVGKLLPAEGDFLAIIIDALDGDDHITVGPTVQKSVWIDGGAGDDQIEILSGNAILTDVSEFVSRNETAAEAYVLSQQAVLLAARSVSADGRLNRTANFSIAVGNKDFVDVHLAATQTLDNVNVQDLIDDLNEALNSAGLGADVQARETGGRVEFYTLALGNATAIRLQTATADSTVSELGFGDPASTSVQQIVENAGNALTRSARFTGLTIDSPTDVDYYRFELVDALGADAALSVSSISLADGMVVEILDPGDEHVIATSSDGVVSLDGFAAGEYLLRVTSNLIPTIYTLDFDFKDGNDPLVLDLASSSDVVRRDVMLGGAGNDILIGGAGEDWAFGGEGNDVLSGGPDRQASDLLFGEAGNDIFQIIPDALPFVTGTEQTLIPTQSDQLFGGEGDDQVLFLGGDTDRQGRPVPDSVAIRYNRFLQRYEFTALVWDTTNQEFVQKTEDVPVIVTAAVDAPIDGRLGADVHFTLTIDDGPSFAVTVEASATQDNGDVADLADDVAAAIGSALQSAGIADELVRVDNEGQRLRIVRLATGADASLEVTADADELESDASGNATNALGFRLVQTAVGTRAIFEQYYAYYQAHDVEQSVINTRDGDDTVHADPEYRFPNTSSEWGIDLGDFEQGGTISALTIIGGDGADRLFGGPLDDTIDGGAGADVIFGGSGNDDIIGGSGNDLLFGNSGLAPDTLELVTNSLGTAANDTFDFAAALPTVVPVDNSSAFNELILSFHLGDPADWYYIRTPSALKAFGGAEAATLLGEMLTVQEMHEVNERLVPLDGAILEKKLFAA
ncbi:MAG: hypothetical protein H6953_19580, partial [Chromatiaceae bacterium]|nr:hypothetical protein [Chromatiaceae bacterium]